MQLKYLKNILACQDGAAKITALSWSANNMKLAVCTADRFVLVTMSDNRLMWSLWDLKIMIILQLYENVPTRKRILNNFSVVNSY